MEAAEPFPQGDPDQGTPWLELARRPFATFVCVACGHIFAGDVPAMFEDLPRCPLDDACSWIYRILELGLWH